MKHDEKSMREEKSPCPQTLEELTSIIKNLADGDHDYGTCVYAMSLASSAAHNFIAHKLGVTGFQSSCADMDAFKRSRGIKGSFIILMAEDLLYPQYDLRDKLNKWIDEQREWLRGEARKKLKSKGAACDEVVGHWEGLAK